MVSRPSKDDETAHERLRAHPVLFALIGVSHTLLTAGIVFGWASLLPVLRQEGVDLSPSEFASVFTHGAIGNYLSSLPFGLLLDKTGPKTCGIVSSVLFGVGVYFCSLVKTSTFFLDVGFTLLGFVSRVRIADLSISYELSYFSCAQQIGPAIQLPTLHLARLFPGEAREGGGGGAALMMSAQAGAFDGGTMVFAIFAAIVNWTGVSTEVLFRCYMIVPLYTFLTAVFFWPNTILPDSLHAPEETASYVGRSPYLSPATTLSFRSTPVSSVSLKDAPLSVILSHPSFYCLGLWVSVHILKLNFVVATINDQLDFAMSHDMANTLIAIFGAMLPFGFVVLPAVAYMLSRSSLLCFQIANVVGVLYGLVLTFFPGVASYQVLVVFVAVATSRQLVYSTVFHQTGELFGFRNYGVLLGLINVVVSGVSLVQGPLVEWGETQASYFGPNAVLLLATIPLFVIVFWTNASSAKSEIASLGTKKKRTLLDDTDAPLPNETTSLTERNGSRPRSSSGTFYIT